MVNVKPRVFQPRLARSALRTRPRSARGAAYVEAIILIMFMIIIFSGVQYLARYYNAKQKALSVARRCAWHFSKNACVLKGIPEDCISAVGGPSGNEPELEEEPNGELYRNVKTAQTAAQDPNASTQQVSEDDPPPTSTPEADLRGGVNAKMSGMLEMIVGQSLTAVDTQEIKLTPMLAGAESEITVGFYMPCNLKHEDPLEVAKDLFFLLLPSGL